MLYEFIVLKNNEPTRHSVFATSATSEDDARTRIRKANMLGAGETIGSMIVEPNQESEAA